MFNPSLFYKYGENPQSLLLHLDAGDTSSYPGTGSDWTDLSGNGYNATLSNSPSFDSSNNGSLIFNGTNQFAQTNIYKRSVFSSFNIWVKVLSNSVGGGFVSCGGTVTTNYIQLGGSLPNTKFQFGLAASTANNPLNTWVMLTGIHTATTDYLYVNGTLVASASTVSAVYLEKNITIGKRFDNTYVNAHISSVKIWNYPLTTTEITAEFNAIKSRYGL